MGDHDKGAVLLALACGAIEARLGLTVDKQSCIDTGCLNRDWLNRDWLNDFAATFVTLTQFGELRGCIGSLEAYRSLREDVQASAVAAAFHDPRFSALSADEYARLQVEVSLLTALQSLDVNDEDDALAKIRPGMDGVVLQCATGGITHKATFLPQVWQQLIDPVAFMNQLKLKAGLDVDFWHPDMRLFVYQVHKYSERALREHAADAL